MQCQKQKENPHQHTLAGRAFRKITQGKGPEVSSDFSYSKTRKEVDVFGAENKKEYSRR